MVLSVLAQLSTDSTAVFQTGIVAILIVLTLISLVG